jgi:hypothetical protein
MVWCWLLTSPTADVKERLKLYLHKNTKADNGLLSKSLMFYSHEEQPLSQTLINKAQCHKDVWWSGHVGPTFLTLAPYGGRWSVSWPLPLCPPGKSPPLHTHFISSWVASTAGLGHYREKKNLLSLVGIEMIAQFYGPLPNHYSEWATLLVTACFLTNSTLNDN